MKNTKDEIKKMYNWYVHKKKEGVLIKDLSTYKEKYPSIMKIAGINLYNPCNFVAFEEMTEDFLNEILNGNIQTESTYLRRYKKVDTGNKGDTIEYCFITNPDYPKRLIAVWETVPTIWKDKIYRELCVMTDSDYEWTSELAKIVNYIACIDISDKELEKKWNGITSKYLKYNVDFDFKIPNIADIRAKLKAI